MNTTASSPAHTPGPWYLEDEVIPETASSVRVVDEQGVTIATVHHQHLDPEEWLPANARLIATAPTLLERLTEIRNITESLDYEDGDDEGRMNAMENALDTIREIGYATIKEVRGNAA